MVSYDITGDGRRRRLQKLLEGYGRRVQYSVFECDLKESQYGNLRREIERMIDSTLDSVRCYILCDSCARRIESSGRQDVCDDDAFFMV